MLLLSWPAPDSLSYKFRTEIPAKVRTDTKNCALKSCVVLHVLFWLSAEIWRENQINNMKPRFCEPASPKTMEMGKSFKFLEPKCDFSDTAFIITSGGWGAGCLEEEASSYWSCSKVAAKGAGILCQWMYSSPTREMYRTTACQARHGMACYLGIELCIFFLSW